MAVVLGVYERLIEAIGNVATDREKRKSHFFFLTQILSGAAAAIILLSWLMDFLLNNYPAYTYLFFIGLIAGSIPSIYRSHSEMRPAPAAALACGAGFALILAFSLFAPESAALAQKGSEIHRMTIPVISMLVLSGFLAGGSMIVPGISGSFILVLLGQYHTIILAVKNFNFLVIGVVGVGAMLGIWGFAKLIDRLLKAYPRETVYFILGLVTASLYPIFPGLPATGRGIALAVLLAAGGVLISFKLGQKK